MRALYLLFAIYSGLAIAASSLPLKQPTASPYDTRSPACFSPDEGCNRELVSFLSSAKKSLDIAVYDINEPSIVAQILVIASKLPVRVAVDKKQAAGSHSAVPQLVKAGVQVRYGHQRGIMHNKFALVDGAALETGSFNYTTHATEANQENQLYVFDPIVVRLYQDRFEKIWATGIPIPSRAPAKKGKSK